LEDEIVRIEPSGCPISQTQLSFAVSNLNSRIRLHGLSAYELLFRRNQFTGSHINNDDETIIAAQHDARLSNRQSSHRSQQPKSKRKCPTINTPISQGNVIYLKNDRSMHKAREPYVITSKEGEWLTIQKLTNKGTRNRKYRVHSSECFSVQRAPTNPSALNPAESSDEEILPLTMGSNNSNVPTAPQQLQMSPNIPVPETLSPTPATANSDLDLDPHTDAQIVPAADASLPPNHLAISPERDYSSQPRTSSRLRRAPPRFGDYVTYPSGGEEEEGATPGL